MNKLVLLAAVIAALSLPLSVHAVDHSTHASTAAHEEVVDGVKATFKVQTMAAAMKAMGMEMPKGVAETHHISVSFKDVKSGEGLTEGTVAIKVQNPDKSVQTKDLVGMHGHFGADFVLSKSGKYGVMCKFLLKDGRSRQAKFWYTVQ